MHRPRVLLTANPIAAVEEAQHYSGIVQIGAEYVIESQSRCHAYPGDEVANDIQPQVRMT